MNIIKSALVALTIAVGAAHTSQSASAQGKIPSAEGGSVIFALDPQTEASGPIQVSKGDVAWTETARPALVVRLLDDAIERNRPQKSDGVAAGTLLFGFRLSTGTAYCPAMDLEAHNGRVQCFRDLDDDGTFDAGYVTRSRKSGSRYTPAYVRAIAPVSKYRYEKVDHQLAEPIELAVVFRGMKDGVPTFRVEFEENRAVETTTCEPVTESVCERLGRHIALTDAPDGRQGLMANARTGPFVLLLTSELAR